MISVAEALAKVLVLADPLGAEEVPLRKAAGRVLAAPVSAGRDQPPFAASVMDGYAISSKDVSEGDSFTVIGEAAAGHGFDGAIGTGQAVRIFTGAPMPEGGQRVVIQEDVMRNGDTITIGANIDSAIYVRPAGADFRTGDQISAPRLLAPADLALAAAMNLPRLPVVRRPVVALIATGDELVMPGEAPSPDQIIASNSFGLAAMAEAAGAEVRMLPIARDNIDSLKQAFAMAAGADLIVTIGGASVGDHDLVGHVAADLGMKQSFYKIAMRPGKPLMAGRVDGAAMLGLPGNPVSSMVCGQVFLVPMIRKMQGLDTENAAQTATLTCDVTKNGIRAHYMRARVKGGQITPFDRQDSALLTVLAQANALLIRPVDDPARQAGETVTYLPL